MNLTAQQKTLNDRLERSFGMRVGVFAVWLGCISAAYGQGSPQLVYSSAKAGPNQGWAGSSTRGAAITVWGRNLGSTRGSSFVSIAGVALTNDSDYAEWGATTNPTTAKGFQRVTFWLNSGMPPGNTAGITVTVNGHTSASLPFTIDNTGGIRFIDETNGNDSWDGQYPDHSLGGSHGPWKTTFLYSIRSGTTLGTFFYQRGGTYQNIFDPSSGHPSSAYIGYFEQGSGPTCATAGNLTTCGCNVYYATIDGTDALRYTVTSYPGELAVWQDVTLNVKSSYWTFANFRLVGSASLGGDAAGFSLGDEWSMCANCQRHSNGLTLLGTESTGYFHHVIWNLFGDGFQVLANYVNDHPVACSSCGYDNTTAYPFYLSSGDNRLVADNEIHGGSMYGIHNYDEERCAAPYSVNRRFLNQTFDSNWIDMTRDSVTPVDIRDAIVTGMNLDDTNGNTYTNVTFRNNIFFSRDSLVSEGGIQLHSENSKTLNGVHIDNNTFAGPFPACVNVFYSSLATWTNVDFTNNICTNISQYEWDNGGSPKINPTLDHNLFGQAARINGNGTATNTVVGGPAFVNPPTDFHLQASSPAIQAGIPLAGITRDFDANPRPSGAPYDLGALEFISGGSTPPPPPSVSVGITPGAVTLGPGQSQPFTGTVTGSTNTAVTWSFNPIVGTLSTAGMYTAPASISTQQQVQVTATSAADSTRSATAIVTLQPPASPPPPPPPAVSITIAPPSVTLGQSQQQAFAASVTGSSNTSVTWSYTPMTGTLTSSGQYTAPASIASTATVTITATSVADATKSATAIVTLQPPVSSPPPPPPPPAASITIAPPSVTLGPSQQQPFTATVTGSSNTAVTWSFVPAIGMLSSAGLYTAPAMISGTLTIAVKATSVADPTKSASATITLQPPVQALSVNVSPNLVNLRGGRRRQFRALVTGSANVGVTWSLSPAMGRISATGVYTAPATFDSDQTVAVIATSKADPSKSARATVNLILPGTVEITNFGVTQITGNSARIIWDTNIATVGQVQYGTTTAYDQSVPFTASQWSHSVTLTGLTPGTVYHYRVQAWTAPSGSVTSTADLTFTTPDQ